MGRVDVRLLLGSERRRGGRPLHRQGVPAPFLPRGVARRGEGDRLPVLVGQLRADLVRGRSASPHAASPLPWSVLTTVQSPAGRLGEICRSGYSIRVWRTSGLARFGDVGDREGKPVTSPRPQATGGFQGC